MPQMVRGSRTHMFGLQIVAAYLSTSWAAPPALPAETLTPRPGSLEASADSP